MVAGVSHPIAEQLSLALQFCAVLGFPGQVSGFAGVMLEVE